MGNLQLVEETVAAGGRPLAVLRPRDAEELIDEEAFEREEFLPYWAELWPSAVALAQTISALPVAGRRVVELGCGLALPGLAAAAAGAHVLVTDWSPDAVSLAAVNARRNGLQLETAVVAWERPEPLLERAPWDLVLASDVLYERRHVPLLLDLLPRLTDEVLVADPGRPPLAEFIEGAEAEWKVYPARKDSVSVFRLTSAPNGRTSPTGAGVPA